MAVPTEYGGGGIDDFRFNLIVTEELHRVGMNGAALGFALHNDIALPYFCTTPPRSSASGGSPGWPGAS